MTRYIQACRIVGRIAITSSVMIATLTAIIVALKSARILPLGILNMNAVAVAIMAGLMTKLPARVVSKGLHKNPPRKASQNVQEGLQGDK